MSAKRRTRMVRNLDTDVEYVFTNKTPLEAMEAMKYTLNLSHKCDAVICTTKSGRHLYFDHLNRTYSTIND